MVKFILNRKDSVGGEGDGISAIRFFVPVRSCSDMGEQERFKLISIIRIVPLENKKSGISEEYHSMSTIETESRWVLIELVRSDYK